MNFNYQSVLKTIERVSQIDTNDVVLVNVIEEECPDCDYDPIIGESNNPRCPTCGGTHRITTEKKSTIRANVEYVSGLESALDRGGKFEEGTVVLTVHVSQLTSSGFPAEDFNEKSVDFFDVHGRRYTLENFTPQYLHGFLYEIIMKLKRHTRGE